MLVKDIMNTSVRTVTANTGIHEAAMLMCFNKISGLPVVDADNHIVGILSEKDILHRMYPKVDEFMAEGRVDFESMETDYQDVINLKVEDLMIRHVHCVTPDIPVLKAVSVMFLRKIRRIPVAVDNKLVGIISIGDVHKAIFKASVSRQLEIDHTHAAAERRAAVG